ncbi:hypothetical protein SAMN05216381_3705 [Pseudomonas seleniipraecipitans]|uniref:Uncharacterized protein n=2 Tax=Phytopseudomonas seleniipraecipitans TaxID=640205 RepID=A0A1G7T9J6_9GAMM|nr:hypothetical protein SAMN05216381_3705 [Pseudomonas seleniipraecipitans]
MARSCARSIRKHPNMNTNQQIQTAIHTLSNAFAPLACHILAARKGSFSFTVVDHTGVAQHTQRLYPGQYSDDSLKGVIERTRQALRR